jgi:hypothetical protein
MKRNYILSLLVTPLIFSACQKEAPKPTGSHSYYGTDWPTFYYYYYFEGIATDSSGAVMQGRAVTIDGPCYAQFTTDSNGYFFLSPCEMDSKWSYHFPEQVTVYLRDTSSWSVVATTEFPSELLIENDTVEVNLEFPI